MFYLKFPLLTLALFISLPAIATDISGVELGASFAAAKEAILKANSGFKISYLKKEDGKDGGVVASKYDVSSEDTFIALLNENGRVWFVRRRQVLNNESRIQKTVLLASLREKFGTPSLDYSGSYGHAMVWEYFNDGKQYFGPQDKGPCAKTGPAVNSIPGTDVRPPGSFTPTCGKKIYANTERERDGMISAYTVGIMDSKSMFDELTARAAQKEAVRKMQLENEKARGTKPNI